MTSSPRHGAPGCPCEDCLSARISLTAAMAEGRDLTGLRARLDDCKVRASTSLVVLRSAS
jgi:hypothetical protein